MGQQGIKVGRAYIWYKIEINDIFQGPFVAAFASTNLGDASPNTKGPRCIDTGLPCDHGTSTCDGRSWNCIASGPGKDMLESTEIIGKVQFEKALVSHTCKFLKSEDFFNIVVLHLQ